MGELYPMTKEDRRQDNATPEDAVIPAHRDEKDHPTEQQLLNEAGNEKVRPSAKSK